VGDTAVVGVTVGAGGGGVVATADPAGGVALPPAVGAGPGLATRVAGANVVAGTAAATVVGVVGGGVALGAGDRSR
jgi:hypothetical protein